ncbi:MAG: phage GP46 family protein [Gluconacetobacter sp.]
MLAGMAGPDISTIKLGIHPLLSIVDLVIDPIGMGYGRIAIDRTVATPLLIALGTDRRADPDDVVPEMLAAPPGTVELLFARRGWVGDVLLPAAERYGTRAWLYTRGKATDGTRVAVADCTAQAVAPIAAYHGIEIETGARWHDRARGILLTTASAAGLSVNMPVALL